MEELRVKHICSMFSLEDFKDTFQYFFQLVQKYRLPMHEIAVNSVQLGTTAETIQVVVFNTREHRLILRYLLSLLVLLTLEVRVLVRYDRRLNLLIEVCFLHIDLANDSLQWLVLVVGIWERILFHVVTSILVIYLHALFLVLCVDLRNFTTPD